MVQSVRERLLNRWRQANQRQRVAWGLVLVAVLAHVAHQLVFVDWYIEDAAISFAYARNLAEGEGLVAFRGGERIEGYSNPTWVFLLFLWELVGVNGFISGKIMSVFFGSGSLILAYRLAREAIVEDRDGLAATAAPIVMGISSHHAIWSASTLENSLLGFLILGGCLQLIRDLERPGWPWSALWFLAVGLTRPEGTLYAAIAGLVFLLCTLRDGRGLGPALRWLTLYWGPMLALVLVRLWYFAWPLPNTYYAKFVTQGNFPMRWYQRGWMQVREFSERLWAGWFLWVYVIGLLGLAGRRGRLAVAVCVGGAAMLLWPGPELLQSLSWWPELPEPKWWLQTRIGLIAALMVGLPVMALGRPGGRVLGLCWSLAAAAVWFGVLSNGDWMRGLRWMSLFSGTAAVLFAAGLYEFQGWLSRFDGGLRWGPLGWACFALLLGLQVPPNASFSQWYRGRVDDYPTMIKRRVDHTNAFAEMVFLEERIRPLDMDMGAHMWWHDQHPADMAGLVDIPISMHNYGQRAFIEEYVFNEVKPHFAHVHGVWAKQSGYLTYDPWDRQYFPYVGYIDGKGFHDGLWARRDLVVQPDWSHAEDRRVAFARGVTLRGFDLPGAQAAPGRALYLDTAWSTEFQRTEDDPFSVTVFLSRDGELGHSWDLPMGYAILGYPVYPVHWWHPGQVFRGQYTIVLPPDLPAGSWDLGFVVRGAKGYVLGGGRDGRYVSPAATTKGPVLARGEVRFPQAITVVSSPELDRLADVDRLAALEAAADDRCEEAVRSWRLARMHRPRDKRYVRLHEAEVNAGLSRCWALRAERSTDEAPALLAKAHQADHRQDDFQRIRHGVAKDLYARGLAARDADDPETAYRLFTELLAFAPHYSWARRYAEEARDARLGLEPQ